MREGHGAITSLTLHAEQLHDDRVWKRVRGLCGLLRRTGWRLTMFVYPGRALDAGADIGDRIDWLAREGHEIAQHSHYYVATGSTSAGSTRPTELSAVNIRRCLQRDYDYLNQVGHQPVGFVSGGWAMSDDISDWVREHGFLYDCTARTFALRYPHDNAVRGDNVAVATLEGGVLTLPTTGSVTDAARALPSRRMPELDVGIARYRLYYLHDYDLLHQSKYLACLAVAMRLTMTNKTTAGELAVCLAQGEAER